MASPDSSLEKTRSNPPLESSENPQNFLKAVKVTQTKSVFDFGPYRLYRTPALLLRDEKVVQLTPKVLETLKVLVENAGRPVSKEELLRAIWPDTFVEESNLTQNVSVLRKALGTRLDGSGYIETIAKRGYRFAAETQVVAAIPEAAAEPAAAVPSRQLKRPVLLVIVVLALCAAGAIVYSRLRSAAAPTIRSLAVLPFKNLSGDPNQDYLADGITELLTTELSKALPLRVTSAASARRMRGRSGAAIAQALHADAWIEGSAVRAGDRLRVTVQLIQPPSNRPIWTQAYDRAMQDVPSVEEDITLAIAHEIRALTAPPRRNAARVNTEALEAYLRARYYIGLRTDTDVITGAQVRFQG